MLKYFLFLTQIVLIGCAGPSTPFGANIFISQDIKVDLNYLKNENIKISSYPKKQYYNSPFHFTLNILDPYFNLEKFKYKILYNNKELSRWIKTETVHLPQSKNTPLKIEFSNLAILPGHINQISFLYYTSISKLPVRYDFNIPDCFKSYNHNLFETNPFTISKHIKKNILTYSKDYDFNPSLIAGLIAQESSFNQKALSYAYALGLTQITPTAAKEIRKYKPDWDIYPSFERMDISEIKDHLKKYQINQVNDWRLNPQKSVEGGVLYLDHLESYWAKKTNSKLLAKIFNQNIPYTDILLASYNSGAYRVKKSIKKQKEKWLLSPELKEARKYVMNIKSYCYSFENGVSK